MFYVLYVFFDQLAEVQDSEPKVLFTDLPALWFLPVKASAPKERWVVCKDRKPNPKDYRCPTYKAGTIGSWLV